MTKSRCIWHCRWKLFGKNDCRARNRAKNRCRPHRLFEHDAYYRDLGHLSREDRRRVNFDHPDAFETELLVEHIKTLLSGQHIEQPIYSYADSVRTGEVRRVDPKPLVVVEGILVLENYALQSLMDIKIFVDTDDDIRLLRRVSAEIRKSAEGLREYFEPVRSDRETDASLHSSIRLVGMPMSLFQMVVAIRLPFLWCLMV